MSKDDTYSTEINISEEYNLKPAISIKEARKILGKKISDQLSDEEVGGLIGHMSLMAERLLTTKSVPQND